MDGPKTGQEIGAGVVGSLASRDLLAQLTSESTNRCKAARVQKNGVQRRKVLVEVWGGFLLQRFRVGSPKAPRHRKFRKIQQKNTVKTQGYFAGLGARWREIWRAVWQLSPLGALVRQGAEINVQEYFGKLFVPRGAGLPYCSTSTAGIIPLVSYCGVKPMSLSIFPACGLFFLEKFTLNRQLRPYCVDSDIQAKLGALRFNDVNIGST